MGQRNSEMQGERFNTQRKGDALIRQYEANQERAWALQFAGQALIENGVHGNIIKDIRNNVAEITNPDKESDIRRANQIMNLATQLVKTVLSFSKDSKRAKIYLSAIGGAFILEAGGLHLKNEHIVAPKILEANPSYYDKNIDRIFRNGFGGAGARTSW